MTEYRFRTVGLGDLKTIRTWLGEDHVARWWWDADRQLDEIEGHVSDMDIGSYIIVIDGEDAGYLQCYDMDADDDWTEAAPGSRGIDLFIGEIELAGLGHGTALLQQFSDQLIADGIAEVWADPHPDNDQARRAFAAAGFEDIGEAAKPWGSVRLMRRSATRH